MKKIVVIGCGGIGNYLATPLVRFLEYSDVPSSIFFVDPDTIEKENMARQFGPNTIGMGKAGALVKMLGEQLRPKNAKINSVPDAFSPKTIKSAKRWYWEDGIDVFVGVDNHASRLFIQEEATKLRNVALFIGGNEFHDGQCQIYIRREDKELTPRIDHVHPEMASTPGKFPDDPSCMEAAQSQPQLVFANMLAAASMLSSWWALQWRTQDVPKVNEVVFDATGPSMRPLWSKSLVRKERP